MNTKRFFVALVALLTGQFFPCYSVDVNDKTPYGLMVEFIREPAGTFIIDKMPEFSWIVPKGAGSQKEYQILVSSTRDHIDNNVGDVWNSGMVKSPRSTEITFRGEPLKENTTYFWKVLIKDQNNLLSEYSRVQVFKTGKFGDRISSANIFQIEKLAPVSVSVTSGGNTLFDFGRDAFGTIELNYKTEKPQTIEIFLGEKLLNGKIDSHPGGTIRYTGVKLPVIPGQVKYTIKLPSDKRNTTGAAVLLPDSLGVVMPFRYAEIRNEGDRPGKGDVIQSALFHYFDETQSSFSCSDTVLNQIWELCRYSIKATSFTGIYIDGDRERIAYEADAYINQLGHYTVDREYAMARNTIEHFMSSPTWPTEWLLHTAMMAYQDYYYTGNKELLEKYYTQLKNKSLEELARGDGLISSLSARVNGSFMLKLGFKDTSSRIRDIVDWPPAQKDTGWKLATPEGERDGYEMMPVSTVVNCLFYNNMKIMAEIAGILDKKDDKDNFGQMALKVRNSINEKLFSTSNGIYIDGEGSQHSSLHSNMMALAMGVVPEKSMNSVVSFIKSRGMACSVYGAQYLLEGLYLAGEGQYALDLMRATNDRSWWNMIRTGSTISMEAWDMKYKPNSDWNHAWGAVPANIIPRYLWGIRPKTPGSGIITISPQMGDLTFSKIVTPLISGQVKGEFRIVNDKIKIYSIEIPANTTGEFSVKLMAGETTVVNGEKINASNSIIRLNPGMNKIEIVKSL